MQPDNNTYKLSFGDISQHYLEFSETKPINANLTSPGPEYEKEN
jgi:hypothetical protein